MIVYLYIYLIVKYIIFLSIYCLIIVYLYLLLFCSNTYTFTSTHKKKYVSLCALNKYTQFDSIFY